MEDLPITGPHNRVNALAAAAAALAAGASRAGIQAGWGTFRPLPHRLERVAEAHGILFVNDSKATNLASCTMALRSFPEGRVLVILGGRDKGSDFTALADDLRRHARAVLAMGEAGPRIARVLEPALGGQPPVRVVADLGEAVAAAASAAEPGDTVLLAPACASFDAYRDFEHRGEHFRRMVAAWIRREAGRGA